MPSTISTTASLSSLRSDSPSSLAAPLEIEVVRAAGVDVELSLEQLAQPGAPVAAGPSSFEHQPDVVGLPRLGDDGIDGAGVAAKERHGAAIRAPIAEDGLEGTDLAAITEHLLHMAEIIVVQHDLGSVARQAAPVSLGVGVHVRIWGVEVDPLKIAEIDRIRTMGPDPAERLGVSDLEPQA